MEKSLMDYLTGPIFCIVFYLLDGDFNENIIFFVISEIIFIISIFFGCVYNEFIILSCSGMDYNTSDEIKKRAKDEINNPNIYILKDANDDDDDDEDSISDK